MELKIAFQLILEATYTERIERFKCRVVEKRDNMILSIIRLIWQQIKQLFN